MTGRTWWAPALEAARAWLADGDAAGAAREARALLDCDGLPPRVEWEARSIELSQVPRLAELCAGTRVGTLALEVEPGWTRFNPSIAADGSGGARCIVRSANYRIVGGRYERIDGARGPLENRHHLCALDADLAVLWAIELEDACALRAGHGPLLGFEDLRLFAADGAWSALATIAEADPRGALRMARITLDDDARIQEAHLLPGPHPERIEKNWMPVADGSGARAMYRVGHTLVLGIDDPSTPILARHRSPLLVRTARGGSQVVPFADGWLAVVHEAWRWPDGRRWYVHRFVAFDADLRVTHASPVFTFVHDGVEFCAGVAALGDDLVLTAGAQDAEALIVAVPVEAVRVLLEPIGAASASVN